MKRRRSKHKSRNELNETREIEKKLIIEKERRKKSRKRTRGPYRKSSLSGRQKKM